VSTYRAESKYVDAGRNGDGSPATRKVWTIDGPEPFGGLTANDEGQAKAVVAALNDADGQAAAAAERARLAASVTATRETILLVPGVTRCNASFNGRMGTFVVDGGDDVAIARAVLEAGPELITFGRKCVFITGSPRVQFDRFTPEALIEAVLRDAAAARARVRIWLADGTAHEGIAHADPDGERMFAATDGPSFEAWWGGIGGDLLDDVRIVRVEVLP
jgi:hypothetical protein